MELIEKYLGNPKKISDAVGFLRDIQCGALKLLIEFDRICKAHKLQYFICYGTLLGAMRTGKFIPWDDDVDVVMPRHQYSKIVDIFNKSCTIPRVYAKYHSDNNGAWNLIKICHQDLPQIYVDVFSMDARYVEMSYEDHEEFTKFARNLLLENIERGSQWPSALAFHQHLLEACYKKISHLEYVEGIKPSFFMGVEFYHDTVFSSFDYDVIYPLRTIKFEGHVFPCVNDPDLFLTLLYGDYMRLPAPNKFTAHTILDEKIPVKQMIELKKFLRKDKRRGR